MTTTNEDSKSDSRARKYVKILILGNGSVGKTSLIQNFLGLDDMNDENNLFEEYRTRMIHNNNEVDVGLFDLSPGSNAPERRSAYPTDTNAVLLCFSISNYESLTSIYNLWIHEVRAHFGKLIPILLVGLKSDERFNPSYSVLFQFYPTLRLIQTFEGETVHRNYYLHGHYMECSKHVRRTVVNVINMTFCAAMEDLEANV